MTTDWAVKSIPITFYVQSFSVLLRQKSNCPPTKPLFPAVTARNENDGEGVKTHTVEKGSLKRHLKAHGTENLLFSSHREAVSGG